MCRIRVPLLETEMAQSRGSADGFSAWGSGLLGFLGRSKGRSTLGSSSETGQRFSVWCSHRPGSGSVCWETPSCGLGSPEMRNTAWSTTSFLWLLLLWRWFPCVLLTQRRSFLARHTYTWTRATDAPLLGCSAPHPDHPGHRGPAAELCCCQSLGHRLLGGLHSCYN